MTEIPSIKVKDVWLDSLLPEVAFDGWSEAVATKAAGNAGLGADEQALGAPSGVIDLIDHFFDKAEDTARQRLVDMDFSDLSVRDKVTTGTLEWLRALEDNKEAVRRAMSWGVLPWRFEQPIGRLGKVADMIWTSAGDTSKDYNRYTKRGLLALTLPSIIIHWLDHDDPVELKEFVERQINRASGFGRRSAEFPKRVWECLSSFGERK